MNKIWNFIKKLFKGFKTIKKTNNLDVINNFELARFEGTWYEITRYDHWFERGLTAVYTKYTYDNVKKCINIENFGKDIKSNNIQRIIGKAKLHDVNYKNNGWLKVSFFGPFYNDYKIIYADEKFENIIVTGHTYDYFWILSKHQYLDAEKLIKLIEKSVELGFEEEKMIF